MQTIQDIPRRHRDHCPRHRSLRVRQCEWFDDLAAASEAEVFCPFWITDRQIFDERVSE